MNTKFKRWLTKEQITTYRVAQETGIPRTTLWEWERGKHIPRPETIKKVADYYDVRMEDLI